MREIDDLFLWQPTCNSVYRGLQVGCHKFFLRREFAHARNFNSKSPPKVAHARIFVANLWQPTRKPLYSGFQDLCNKNCDENRTCAFFHSHFEWQIMRMRRFSSLFFVAKILKTAVQGFSSWLSKNRDENPRMRKFFNSKFPPKGRACADSRRDFWTTNWKIPVQRFAGWLAQNLRREFAHAQNFNSKSPPKVAHARILVANLCQPTCKPLYTDLQVGCHRKKVVNFTHAR